MNLELNRIWKRLVTKYSNHFEELWVEIESKYSEKNRKYHNLSHIERIFKVYNDLKPEFSLEDNDVLEFSIWYHDIIYSASKSNNEEESAKLAESRLNKIGIGKDRITKCFNLILSTKNHYPIEESIDNQLLIDLDLEILGSNWSDYQIYMENIRQEYKIYPSFMYNNGRKKALESFLSKEKIYQTTWFQVNYETKARKNIKQEIELLN